MKTIFTALLTMYSIAALTQVSQDDYNTLMQQYLDCCTPESYSESSLLRPTAVANTNRCTPKPSNTEFLYSDEVLRKTGRYNFTLYYVKFAAVPESSYDGGMPDGAWRLYGGYMLGTYIASYGYCAVMYGPYQEEHEARIVKADLEDLGYCDIKIIPVTYSGEFTVELVKVGGYYVSP